VFLVTHGSQNVLKILSVRTFLLCLRVEPHDLIASNYMTRWCYPVCAFLRSQFHSAETHMEWRLRIRQGCYENKESSGSWNFFILHEKKKNSTSHNQHLQTAKNTTKQKTARSCVTHEVLLSTTRQKNVIISNSIIFHLSLEHWDRGFESHSKAWMFVSFLLSCV
jgi:hypothetical protein